MLSCYVRLTIKAQQHTAYVSKQDVATTVLKGERLGRYPAGARRAIVVLRGKDSQFWAGNYGAKFASPSLAFAGAPLGDAERAAVDTAAS